MSIFQEYERIKKDIGFEKWNCIGTYIENYHPELRLDQIIYNSNNWIDFEKWYYKEIKLIDVKVFNTWHSDYDDYRASVEISKDENVYGTIVASYDEFNIRNLVNNINKPLSNKELSDAFTILVSREFNNYKTLPKISKCSKLLQSIYDSVCSSDSAMCHISDEDWNDYYIDEYSENDIKILEKEIKTYGLEKVIGIDDEGYKIVGYGDLETRFIDDRYLSKSKDLDSYER